MTELLSNPAAWLPCNKETCGAAERKQSIQIGVHSQSIVGERRIAGGSEQYHVISGQKNLHHELSKRVRYADCGPLIRNNLQRSRMSSARLCLD